MDPHVSRETPSTPEVARRAFPSDRLLLAEKSAGTPPPLRPTPPVGTPHTATLVGNKLPEESLSKE